MSERNPKRFEEGSNAQQRSSEEQQRLMEEYDQARYEEVFPEGGDAENAHNEAMAAREYEANMVIEERIMQDADARRMYMIAQQVAELKANGSEAKIIADKEDKLQELLEAYAEKARAGRDIELRNAEMERDTVKGREIRLGKEIKAEEELAKRFEEVDFIINSTDEAWTSEKTAAPSGEKAAEEPASVPEDIDKDRVKDLEEARSLADIEEIGRLIRDNPETAKEAGIEDKLRALIVSIDEALAESKASEEEVEKLKNDGKLDVEMGEDDDKEVEKLKDDGKLDLDDETSDDDVEKLKNDGKLDTDEEEPDVEKLKADGKLDVDTEDDGTKELPKVETDDSTPEKGDGKKDRWWKRAYARAGAIFITTVSGGMERLRSSDKKKVVAAVGAMAIVGGVIAWRLGVFGHGGGGGNAHDHAQNFGQGNGSGGTQTPETSLPLPNKLPSGDDAAYPWNWAREAVGADKAEGWLRGLADKAADAGHSVQWHGSGTQEWVSIDGNSNTQDVIGILSGFAK